MKVAKITIGEIEEDIDDDGKFLIGGRRPCLF